MRAWGLRRNLEFHGPVDQRCPHIDLLGVCGIFYTVYFGFVKWFDTFPGSGRFWAPKTFRMGFCLTLPYAASHLFACTLVVSLWCAVLAIHQLYAAVRCIGVIIIHF